MSVMQIVQETRAIKWWIDQQIAKGRSDDEIARELPLATAFITGKIDLDALLERRP